MKSVVVPLEEQINGVEGMDYITSVPEMTVLPRFRFSLNRE
jgi:multidrug efflux pump subunit AcrB